MQYSQKFKRKTNSFRHELQTTYNFSAGDVCEFAIILTTSEGMDHLDWGFIISKNERYSPCIFSQKF